MANLPADPVMLQRALDNCTQDPETWDYLYRTEALAMAAEIERLRAENARLHHERAEDVDRMERATECIERLNAECNQLAGLPSTRRD